MFNFIKVHNVRRMVDRGELRIGRKEGELAGDLDKAREYTDGASDYFIWVVGYFYVHKRPHEGYRRRKAGWFRELTTAQSRRLERALNKDQGVKDAMEELGLDMKSQRFLHGIKYLFNHDRIELKGKIL